MERGAHLKVLLRMHNGVELAPHGVRLGREGFPGLVQTRHGAQGQAAHELKDRGIIFPLEAKMRHFDKMLERGCALARAGARAHLQKPTSMHK